MIDMDTLHPDTLCMLICIFDMSTLDTTPTGIGEEQLADAAPLVRSLVVQRLETIWRTCQPHIDGTGGRPDPRFVEAGIRVLDRLMRLYRLDAPQPAPPEPVSLSDRAAVVDSMLKELESRLPPH